MVQDPVEFVTVTRPVEALTEQAVEDPAEYVIVPVPALDAVTVNVSP